MCAISPRRSTGTICGSTHEDAANGSTWPNGWKLTESIEWMWQQGIRVTTTLSVFCGAELQSSRAIFSQQLWSSHSGRRPVMYCWCSLFFSFSFFQLGLCDITVFHKINAIYFKFWPSTILSNASESALMTLLQYIFISIRLKKTKQTEKKT